MEKNFSYLVEDYQKKNPTKNFGEAILAVNRNSTVGNHPYSKAALTEILTSDASRLPRSRAALHEAANNMKKDK
ncbi:hypothetical protein Y032_0089g2222 [Ancylostoma ceylanicum]|uniref:Uncharacterized protein n=1 Tax=Ancylostoma ceylanicum TaxID=53326 RepID=A0A016TN01_9BILA|nr:hypothetical protein Y032_0089g2222 [Ancylostoma ceylanicum]